MLRLIPVVIVLAVSLGVGPAGAAGLELVGQFGDGRLRHPAPIRSLALSPDGKTLAVSLADGPVVYVWDVATARPVRQLRLDATRRATVVGFAADGRRLVVVRHTALLGDHPGRDEAATLDTHTGMLTAWEWGSNHTAADPIRHLPYFTVAPDGKVVTGMTADGDMNVWDLGTGRKLRTLGRIPDGWMARQSGSCFSPDGTEVAVWDRTPDVYIAPIDGRRPFRRLPIANSDSKGGVVVWPQANRLVVVSSEGLRVAIDPTTGREVGREVLPSDEKDGWFGGPNALMGTALVTGYGKSVVALDLFTLKLIPGRVFAGCEAGYDMPAAGNRAGTVLAIPVGHAVRLFDPRTGASLHPDLDRYPLDAIGRFEVSADGRRLLTAGYESSHTWDFPAGTLLAVFDRMRAGFQEPGTIALSPDGRRVAGTAIGQRAVVRDAETGVELTRFTVANGKVAGYTNRDRIWIHHGDAGGWSAVGPTGQATDPPLPSSLAARYIAVSPDGRRLAESGKIALSIRGTAATGEWVEIENNRDRPQPELEFLPTSCAKPIRFSPDGRRLLTWDDGLSLWDVDSRPTRVGRLFQCKANAFKTPDAAFRPDGRRVAAATDASDGTSAVHVWESASGRELGRLVPPDGATACAFTADGCRLIVALPDTTFAVYDYTAWEVTAVASPVTGDPWDRLADPDPRVGLAAVRDLAADPTAVRRLSDHYTPTDAPRLAALIRALGAAEFRRREEAAAALAAAGEAAEAPLRAAAADPSAEVRARAGGLVHRLTPVWQAGALRAVRAVEVLERIGTPEARTILKQWAAAGPSIRGTEAAAAAARLAAGR